MEIYPRDLGTENYLAILRRRLSPVTNAVHYRSSAGMNAAVPAPHEAKRLRNRRLRRYWTRGLNLSEADTEKVGSLVWNSAQGTGSRVASLIFTIYLFIFGSIALGSGSPVGATVMLAAWMVLMFAMLASPRQSLRKAHQRALETTEVEALLPTARGRLETAYVNLVRDAQQTEVPSAGAQEEIRAALRALGETIAQLPAEAVRPQDATDLTRKAHALRAQASGESDSVVRDSLLRQAVTLEKQIGNAHETARSARRVQTLRREVRVQMDALRTALLAFNDGAVANHQTGTVTTALSDAMQQITQEAQAIALARQELADQEIAGLLGQAAPVVAPPITKSLLTPQPPAVQEAPPQQVVQSRQWWRNGG